MALAASDANLQEHQEANKDILHAALEGQVESLTLKCRELESLLACKEELCTKLSYKVEIEKNVTQKECTEINNSQSADILPDEESMKVDPVEEVKPSETLENNCTNCDTLEKLLESRKREFHECEVEKGSIDCTKCEKLASSFKEQVIANEELMARIDAMKSIIADLEVEIEALKSSLQNALKVDGSNMVSNCDGEMKDGQAKSNFNSCNTSVYVDDNLEAHSDTTNSTLIIKLQDITTELKAEKQATNPSASNEISYESDCARMLSVLELKHAELEKSAKDLDKQIVCHLDKQRLMEVRIEELDNALSSLGEEKDELLLKLEDAANKEAEKIHQILEHAEQEKAVLSTQRFLLEKSLSMATEEIASLKKQAQEDAHQTPVVKVESDQSLGGLDQLNLEKMKELALQISKLKSKNERLCEELEEIESLNLDHMSLKVKELADLENQLRERDAAIKELEEQIIRYVVSRC